jgi:uncharacterized protein (DUF433 family)
VDLEDHVSVKRKLVTADPQVMGGTPCFAGTRVPVRTLLDYLEAGDSMDEFLEGFPTVSRQQVIGFLEIAAQAMAAGTINLETAAGRVH